MTMEVEEFEWKAVSDFVVVGEDGIGRAIIPEDEGWEFEHGALRRSKNWKEKMANKSGDNYTVEGTLLRPGQNAIVNT
jgi:hypothetical protein